MDDRERAPLVQSRPVSDRRAFKRPRFGHSRPGPALRVRCPLRQPQPRPLAALRCPSSAAFVGPAVCTAGSARAPFARRQACSAFSGSDLPSASGVGVVRGGAHRGPQAGPGRQHPMNLAPPAATGLTPRGSGNPERTSAIRTPQAGMPQISGPDLPSASGVGVGVSVD
jgi:hypothetical protein